MEKNIKKGIDKSKLKLYNVFKVMKVTYKNNQQNIFEKYNPFVTDQVYNDIYQQK